MSKKEVKVKEKWVIDKFKEFIDQRKGLDILLAMVAQQLEWLENHRMAFWKEVVKKYNLNLNYYHDYNHKTRIIKELYRMPISIKPK